MFSVPRTLCHTAPGDSTHSPAGGTNPKKGRYHWGNLRFVFANLGQTSTFCSLNWAALESHSFESHQTPLKSCGVKDCHSEDNQLSQPSALIPTVTASLHRGGSLAARRWLVVPAAKTALEGRE